MTFFILSVSSSFSLASRILYALKKSPQSFFMPEKRLNFKSFFILTDHSCSLTLHSMPHIFFYSVGFLYFQGLCEVVNGQSKPDFQCIGQREYSMHHLFTDWWRVRLFSLLFYRENV